MMVTINGNEYEAIRANNDVNGNPRYIIHFLAFINETEYCLFSNKGLYALALYRAKRIGGKVYRGKDYGGGFVFQSYNLQADMDKLTF